MSHQCMGTSKGCHTLGCTPSLTLLSVSLSLPQSPSVSLIRRGAACVCLMSEGPTILHSSPLLPSSANLPPVLRGWAEPLWLHWRCQSASCLHGRLQGGTELSLSPHPDQWASSAQQLNSAEGTD